MCEVCGEETLKAPSFGAAELLSTAKELSSRTTSWLAVHVKNYM